MSIRYEIEENSNAVKVFFDNSEVPSLYQPHYPSGEVWNNAKEAEDWAKLYVASIEDLNAPFAPLKRGEAGKPKPTLEEMQKIEADKLSYLKNINKNNQPSVTE